MKDKVEFPTVKNVHRSKLLIMRSPMLYDTANKSKSDSKNKHCTYTCHAY